MARWNTAPLHAVEIAMSDVTHWSFPTPMQPDAAEVEFDLARALTGRGAPGVAHSGRWLHRADARHRARAATAW